MIMTEDRPIRKKSVRIPCAECVHEYTMATLQRLGNLRCTDVYRSMKSSGGITLQSYSKALHDIDKLLACADSFLPSVPMTAKDVEDSRQFIVTWKRHLLQIRKQLACTCKPVYLQDEVTRVLRERKSKVKFHPVMLEWYLSRYGAADLTPEKIADAVLEHEGTDWHKVKPLAKGKKAFNIRLDADTKAEKDLALKYIQWIFKLETKDVSPTLLADIKNDLAVMKEFEAWRDGDPENYEYRDTYHQFISRLRTAPRSEECVEVEVESRSQYQPEPIQVSNDGEVSVEHTHKDNFTELISYLRAISPRVYYLSGNLTEGRNPEYIQKFASRADFRELFSTLKQYTAEGLHPQARDIMQYIRNVVLYNMIQWGAPAPGQ